MTSGLSVIDARRAADRALTLATVRKIINAQARGSLSADVFLRRLPTQIVVENTTSADRGWLAKHFPGTEEYHGWIKKVGRQRREAVRWVAPLREPATDMPSYYEDHPPHLEVWGYTRPHVCTRYKGYADPAKRVTVAWHCAEPNCAKGITQAKARELGLLIPKGGQP